MTLASSPLRVALFEPRIPPNTGTIARTCAAFGLPLALIEPLGFSIDDRHLKRAGLDYWQHLEWEIADTWAHLQQRLGQDHRYFYYSRFGETEYTDVSYATGDCLVFGSETAGLPPSLTKPNQNSLIFIPTEPNVRSLNLASAVAVAGYEAIRQLRLK